MSDAQRVSDELEIASLLNKYARGVDTKDWELYRSVFTEDAVIDYSSVGITVTALDGVVDALAELVAGQSMSMHYVTNIEGKVDGDTASAIAMWFNVVQIPDSPQVSQFGGRWHHDLVRTGSEWRSRKLRLEVVW